MEISRIKTLEKEGGVSILQSGMVRRGIEYNTLLFIGWLEEKKNPKRNNRVVKRPSGRFEDSRRRSSLDGNILEDP
jgi:hypothetical protein